MNTIPFVIATKRTKYLGINVTKAVGDLYTKNYKTFLRKIREDLNIAVFQYFQEIVSRAQFQIPKLRMLKYLT